MCANIIFDADDTLWKTDQLFDSAVQKFAEQLDKIGLGPEDVVIDLAKGIDRKNHAKLGMARSRFPTSLIETYEQRCKDLKKTVLNDMSDTVRILGEAVYDGEVELYPDVIDTLHKLRNARHRLFLWAEGDEAVQHRWLEKSRLREFFPESVCYFGPKGHVEDVEPCLEQLGIKASTWMVGNSSRLDIQPAAEAGLNAVWIPAHTWYDTSTLPTDPKDSIYLVSQFKDLEDIFTDLGTKHGTGTPVVAATDVIYLFVSAHSALYRQYVLDILAAPRGFHVRFPYHTAWLPSPYRAGTGPSDFCALAKKDNRPAVIVFTDTRVKGEPRRAPHFLPIRTAKITEAELHGDLIQIEFELFDYVSYSNRQTDVANYNNWIKQLDYRPRLNPNDNAYIGVGPLGLSGINPPQSQSEQSDPYDDPAWQNILKNLGEPSDESLPDQTQQDDTAWQNVVRILGDLRAWEPFKLTNEDAPEIPNPFQYSMFYRLRNLTDLRTGRLVPVNALSFGKGITTGEIGYTLRSDTQYRLGMLFFRPKQPAAKVRDCKLEVKLSPDQALTPISQMQIPLNFTYDSRDLVFMTVRTFEHLRGSISFSVTNPDGDNKDEITQVMAPAPMFPIKVQANRNLFWLAFLGLLLGSFISGSSELIAKQLSSTVTSLSNSAGQIQLTLAFLGSVITTSILYWLYRTLK
jgi:putative hydrolase of the HAD superfamily